MNVMHYLMSQMSTFKMLRLQRSELGGHELVWPFWEEIDSVYQELWKWTTVSNTSKNLF